MKDTVSMPALKWEIIMRAYKSDDIWEAHGYYVENPWQALGQQGVTFKPKVTREQTLLVYSINIASQPLPLTLIVYFGPRFAL